MAAPAFGTSSSLAYSATARTTSSVPVPASVAANDVIIVHLYQEDAAPTVTPPTGFTEVTFTTAPQTTGSVLRLRVFWKRATGADTGTYAFTHTSNITEAQAARFTGCITSGTPLEVLGSAVDNSGTTNPTAAITGTTGGADRLLVWGSAQYASAATVTAPTGFTLVQDGSDLSTAYKAQATAGSTGSVAGTMSLGSVNADTLIGLLPITGTTLTGVEATATAAAPAGTVSADNTQTGVTATATAAAPAGSLVISPSFAGVTATATATAPAGSVIGGINLAGVEATATAAAPAGDLVLWQVPHTETDAQLVGDVGLGRAELADTACDAVLAFDGSSYAVLSAAVGDAFIQTT